MLGTVGTGTGVPGASIWAAPDLPCDDPAAGIVEYSSVVLDSLKAANIGDEDDDIVVVGHSLGGLTAPVVAANRPARQVVYLAATYPSSSRSPSTAAHQLEVSETWNRLCHRRIVENGVYSWFPDDAIRRFSFMTARLKLRSAEPFDCVARFHCLTIPVRS